MLGRPPSGPSDAFVPVADTGTDAAVTPPDAGFTDAGVPLDTGAQPTDAGHPDAIINPDAGVRDAVPQDADPPDTGAQDAGFPDTGIAPDAGLPPDTGCAPLVLPAADPAQVARVALPHPIDRALLIADLDADGHDEIVAASAADDAFSVIDYGACGPPDVTTMRNVAIGADGLIRIGNRGLLSAGNGTVAAWQYDSLPVPMIRSLGPATPFSEASYMGGHPSGSHVLITGRNATGEHAFLTINSLAGSAVTTMLNERLIAQPAYLATRGGGSPMFAGVDGFSAMVLQIQGAQTFLEDEANLSPSTAPVVVRPGILPGASHAVVVYGAERGTTGHLRTSRVDTADLNFRHRWGAEIGGRMASSPIVLSRDRRGADDEVRIYYTRTDAGVAGCKVEVRMNTVAECSAGMSIDTFDLGAGESSARVTPLAMYVDDDEHVDLILAAAQSGTVYFREASLDDEAAPPIALGLPIAGTPAVSPSFYQRQGGDGVVLAVPHPAGQVSLIGWPHDANWGPQTRTWMQFRRDSTRSAAF